jgi:hypothetical protein
MRPMPCIPVGGGKSARLRARGLFRVDGQSLRVWKRGRRAWRWRLVTMHQLAIYECGKGPWDSEWKTAAELAQNPRRRT